MKCCSNCGLEFEPKTHNMIYCGTECCRIATNAKIIKRYYERKDRKNLPKRQCSSCSTVLSKYNSSSICNGCSDKNKKQIKEQILAELGYVG